MSGSAYITVRSTRSGKRYVVRFRRGGRYSKLIHAGSFKLRRDAEARRQFVIGELAAGRDPVAALAALEHVQAPRTLRADFEAWLGTRVDLSDGSVGTYRAALKALPGWLLDKPTALVTHSDLQRAFVELELAASTKHTYRAPVAQVFDFASVQPNPARDRRFKLPRLERDEHAPPPVAHVLAMLDRLSGRMSLPFVILEHTGARVEEIVGLPWGDVDVAGNQLRITRTRAKTRRSRWLQVQPWLMDLIADTCPPEDRTAERRVFLLTAGGLRTAMRRACVTAGIPHYSPHALRHRRATLWHGQGLALREIQERTGHSLASTLLDTYTHVMPLEEVPPASLSAAIVRSR